MSHTRLSGRGRQFDSSRLDLRGLLQASSYQVVGEAGDGPAAITLAPQLAPI